MIDPSITDKTEKRYVDSTAQRDCSRGRRRLRTGRRRAAGPGGHAHRPPGAGPRGHGPGAAHRGQRPGQRALPVRRRDRGGHGGPHRPRRGHRRALGFGTGSLVSPRLLLTSHHVLASAEEAATSVVEFGVEEVGSGSAVQARAFALQPGALFLTDAELDFTLVAVAPLSVGGHRLDAYGYNLHRADRQGAGRRAAQHHPAPRRRGQGGGPAGELSAHHPGRLPAVPGRHQPGVVGRPVYNDQWQLVALHHSGVPRKDAEGRWLARDGRVERIHGRGCGRLDRQRRRPRRASWPGCGPPPGRRATDLREQAWPRPRPPRGPRRPSRAGLGIDARGRTGRGDRAHGAAAHPLGPRARARRQRPRARPVPVPASQPPASIPDDALRDALIELARATERPY